MMSDILEVVESSRQTESAQNQKQQQTVSEMEEALWFLSDDRSEKN